MMRELTKIAHHNAVVNAHLKAWQMGDFPSFEAALIALACTLARQNEELQRQVIRRVERDPAIVRSANEQ